jgi:Na+-driven multidrug efflux pump
VPSSLLCSQAFGARNFQALGAILQRALLVNFVFGAAIAVAWLRCVAACLFQKEAQVFMVLLS